MFGFAKEKTAILSFVSDGHLIALVMDKRTFFCLRGITIEQLNNLDR